MWCWHCFFLIKKRQFVRSFKFEHTIFGFIEIKFFYSYFLISYEIYSYLAINTFIMKHFLKFETFFNIYLNISSIEDTKLIFNIPLSATVYAMIPETVSEIPLERMQSFSWCTIQNSQTKEREVSIPSVLVQTRRPTRRRVVKLGERPRQKPTLHRATFCFIVMSRLFPLNSRRLLDRSLVFPSPKQSARFFSSFAPWSVLNR